MPTVITRAAKSALGFLPNGLLIELLVVGGGASGGTAVFGSLGTGGGGGAGELVSGSMAVGQVSWSVTIGAGGAAGTFGQVAGNAGGDTTVGPFTAKGGGGGGPGGGLTTGQNGGSGGGGGNRDGTGTVAGGTSTASQGVGHDGGSGQGLDDGGLAGGGGGASTAGSTGAPGAGLASSISGSSVTYSVGGYNQPALTPGSGGGGGNGGGEPYAGAKGIVLIRYRGPQRATGGTVSTISVGGVSYTLHTFTSNGTFAT